jgi:steroid delta-isomerase-like uncharacterized protein
MKRNIAVLLTVIAAAPMLAEEAAKKSADATLARNKAVARQFLEEAFGPHWRVELVDQLHTQDFVVHTSRGDVGLKEDREALIGWKSSTPDLVIRVDDIMAEGDRVAVRWTGTGTNTGEWNGMPATGKKVTARGMTFWRMKDGKIAEEWGVVDMLSVMKQMGLLPVK